MGEGGEMERVFREGSGEGRGVSEERWERVRKGSEDGRGDG